MTHHDAVTGCNHYHKLQPQPCNYNHATTTTTTATQPQPQPTPNQTESILLKTKGTSRIAVLDNYGQLLDQGANATTHAISLQTQCFAHMRITQLFLRSASKFL